MHGSFPDYKTDVSIKIDASDMFHNPPPLDVFGQIGLCWGTVTLNNVKKVEFTTRVDTVISIILAIKLPITFDLRNRQILKVHYNFGTQSYPSEFTFHKGLKPSIVLSI